jgi:hypothetical protein
MFFQANEIRQAKKEDNEKERFFKLSLFAEHGLLHRKQ